MLAGARGQLARLAATLAGPGERRRPHGDVLQTPDSETGRGACSGGSSEPQLWTVAPRGAPPTPALCGAALTAWGRWDSSRA